MFSAAVQASDSESFFFHVLLFVRITFDAVRQHIALSEPATTGSKTGPFYFLGGILPQSTNGSLKSRLAAFAILDYLGRESALNLMYQCNGLLPSL